MKTMEKFEETWKWIEGSQYYVSSLGVVKSKRGRIVKPWKNNKGYLQVTMRVGGKVKKPAIQKLVAYAFMPSYKGGWLRHINGDLEDNRLCNLRIQREQPSIK